MEANQEALNKKLGAGTDNAASYVSHKTTYGLHPLFRARSMEDLKRQLNAIDNKMSLIGQDFGLIKGTVDRHTADIMAVNNNVKSRPVVDPLVRRFM